MKAMKLIIKGVNLEVTPSLRKYVNDKLVRTVEKFLSRDPHKDAATLDLELVHETRHHKKGMVWKAIANLQRPQKNLWQEAGAEDIHTAIDDLEEILKRELTKYKDRLRSQALRGARQAKKDIHFDTAARMNRKGRIRGEGM